MSKHNYSQYSKKNDKSNFGVAADAVNRNGNTGVAADAVNTAINNEVVHNAGNNDNIRASATLVPDTSHEAVESFLVEETVETVTLPETVKGTVVDCVKLNVRAEPRLNAPVVCVIDVGSEVKIDVTKSPDNWFCVCTATGLEGYCMRQYINASL